MAKTWNGQPKLVLVEGDDCRYFVMHAIGAKFPGTSENEIFVQDFSKVGLDAALRGAKNNGVRHLLIILDAETRGYKSAKDSLESALATSDISNNSEIGVDYFIISQEDCGGNLEELCLKTVFDKSALKEAENFLESAHELFKKENGNKDENAGYIKTPHKAKLAAYLAVARKQNKERGGEFATMKLGEAANAGAFDWNHASLEKFLGKLENFLKK